MKLPALKVSVTRFVDEHQPGFVECQFFDADGARHVIIEKVPVVSSERLWSDSEYPRATDIDCVVVERFTSPQGVPLVRIDTDLPWHIESTSGQTVFVVQESQLTDLASG
jgi:hypothetical protein